MKSPYNIAGDAGKKEDDATGEGSGRNKSGAAPIITA